MPKNRNGCYFCGDKTARTIQVWYRNYEGRHDTTIDSVGRSLCLPCADNEILEAHETMARTWPRVHGCSKCGDKCVVRVQLWVRGMDRKTIQSTTSGFCLTHGLDVYTKMADRLGKDEPRTRGNPNPTNLAAARSHRKQ